MQKKSILFTGGCGYIGSHVLRQLAQNPQYNITIIDNLISGHKEALDNVEKEAKADIDYFKLDIRVKKDFELLKNKRFDVVLHFAAFLKVGEASDKPLMYFENNVSGTINLLQYMKRTNSNSLIFSSTSAVYSQHALAPYTEETEVDPMNPYGLSKRMCEQIIEWCNYAWGLKSFVFRYFNACGCSLDGALGYPEIPSHQLMANAVLGALGLHDFQLVSAKVDTPDGTTIRDYIHVLDLVTAHDIAVKELLKGHKGGLYNLGTGQGTSVMEIINMVKEVTGKDFKVSRGTPRKNELARVYASSKKFMDEFNWKPEHTLKQAIESLYQWFTNHPQGY